MMGREAAVLSTKNGEAFLPLIFYNKSHVLQVTSTFNLKVKPQGPKTQMELPQIVN